MEEIHIVVHHKYPKRKKTKKKVVNESRAKRNVNPSRRIRHAMAERWVRVVEYDDSAYWCLPWLSYEDDDFCGICELCTKRPAKLLDTNFEELTFEYP